MTYVVKASDGQYLCLDIWTGDACLFSDVRDATRAHSEGLAHAMICDVKDRWHGLTFEVVPYAEE